MKRIYLDYNATTPVSRQVQQAMQPFLAEHFGNPSSDHVLGLACKEALADARTRVAQLLAADRDEIVFTSGGTEANNLAIFGVFGRLPPGAKGHLIVSALEHPAVMGPATWLSRHGHELTIVPCSPQGVVSPQDVQSALRPHTCLISIMHANNEIGTIQPLREISQLCRSQQVLLHTDAAQTVGKIPVRVPDLQVDLLTIAGHKVYAPKGVGALFVRKGVELAPLMHGGGQERGLRPGTENVAFAMGLAQALVDVGQNLNLAHDHLERLKKRLLLALRAELGAKLICHGEASPCLPNTLSVSFPGVQGAALLRRIPELCASTGSACHAGGAAVSSTLAALGVSTEVAAGTVRLSLGWQTTDDEIDRAANLLIAAWEELR